MKVIAMNKDGSQRSEFNDPQGFDVKSLYYQVKILHPEINDFYVEPGKDETKIVFAENIPADIVYLFRSDIIDQAKHKQQMDEKGALENGTQPVRDDFKAAYYAAKLAGYKKSLGEFIEEALQPEPQ